MAYHVFISAFSEQADTYDVWYRCENVLHKQVRGMIRTYVHMYVHMYVHVYTYTYVYICIYLCTYLTSPTP
jgi:hypothetical protein